jgi:two-component system phosphate regulon sensor histidine kinase PhoR
VLTSRPSTFMFRPRCSESQKVSLEIETSENDANVAADNRASPTIMENLLSNGLKYTPEGGHVTVSWICDEPHAVISVRDTGVEISRENQTRIFERFFRADRGRTREIGGTGSGLAIVKHLANTFDGEVSVESEFGKESTFPLKIHLWMNAG